MITIKGILEKIEETPKQHKIVFIEEPKFVKQVGDTIVVEPFKTAYKDNIQHAKFMISVINTKLIDKIDQINPGMEVVLLLSKPHRDSRYLVKDIIVKS